MEMSQGNYLHRYLKQKYHFFPFFYKIREQEGRKGPAWGGGQLVVVGGRRMWEKGVGGEYGTNSVYVCV
jgi:hypothetical protein